MKALTLGLLLSGSVCFGQILNGDFELPDIPTGTIQVGGPANWSVGSTVSVCDLPDVASSQFIDLYGVHPGEIYQRVQTAQNGVYRISFDWQVPVPPTTPSLPKISVYWNGADVLDLYAQDVIQWRTTFVDVTGTGNTLPKDTLDFASDGGHGYIDNVVMTVLVVPEPSSILLTGGALSILALTLRMRRVCRQGSNNRSDLSASY